MVRAAAIVVASLLVAACTAAARAGPGSSGGGNASLAGSRWTLRALGGDPVPPAPSVTLNFGMDGRLTGSDGCNQYQGTYIAGGSEIHFAHDLAGTLMACPSPVEAHARRYLEALQRAARLDVDDMRLELQDGTGRLLASFVPAIRSPAHSNWEVIAYNNGKQGVVSILAGTRVSLSFGGDGRLTGDAGCNQYFASYRLDGQTMTIGMVGTTRKFCAEPEGVMQQEALFLEALRSTSTFWLDGDRLELRTADGALQVTLHGIIGK